MTKGSRKKSFSFSGPTIKGGGVKGRISKEQELFLKPQKITIKEVPMAKLISLSGRTTSGGTFFCGFSKENMSYSLSHCT